jgi:hypothetical protein
MDVRLNNRCTRFGEAHFDAELDKRRKSDPLLDLSVFALDFDIDIKNSRLNQIIKNVGVAQFLCEYIWLTVRCRRSNETDSDMFSTDENRAMYESLRSYYDEHSSCHIEHQSPLFNLLYLFMTTDGFEGPENTEQVQLTSSPLS